MLDDKLVFKGFVSRLPDELSPDRFQGECYVIETAYGKDVFVFDETSKIFLSLEEYENICYPWKLVAFKSTGKYYSEEIVLLPEKDVYVLKESIEKGNISTPFLGMYRIFFPIGGNNNKYYPFMVEPKERYLK